MMLTLIERIRERLAQGAYANEAAISHGIVTPILNALGWDSADPEQMVPEYSIVQRGRVDFALFGLGHRPSVFIEVKGVGRAVEGDRQLFEYAFHQGVPICVLTDGREWSFYLPSGQGSYDDRRVYRLQLDDRQPAECERILTRYLARERIRDGGAFEDAARDYRDAAGRREATAILPRAWAELLAESHELLIDIVSEKAEVLCGYSPAADDVLAFLRKLRRDRAAAVAPEAKSGLPILHAPPVPPVLTQPTEAKSTVADAKPTETYDRSVSYTLFGREYSAPTASVALVDILKGICNRDPARIEALADAVRTKKRNPIAGSPAAINPARPDLARAVEIAPGWWVGLNISNRDKMTLIRAAQSVYRLEPEDLAVVLPNA